MKWVEHKSNPDSVPGPDFRAMNKLGAVNEVVSAAEVAAFRTENRITLRGGDVAKTDKSTVDPPTRTQPLNPKPFDSEPLNSKPYPLLT